MTNFKNQYANSELANSLSSLLADTYVLYVKTQNCHWTVQGPNFMQFHQLFESQYKDLALSIDETAERVRMMDQFPPASLREFLEISQLEEISEQLSPQEMLEALIQDHSTLCKKIQDWADQATKLGDENTHDFLIERWAWHEKTIWFLKSHKS
ncbi:MAG: DNA starvation/stationary phase protection protein [Waddliaceae bacterium]|nr:DNA starvation/stationary phase protection protein [Waddliaceae bacterium]